MIVAATTAEKQYQILQHKSGVTIHEAVINVSKKELPKRENDEEFIILFLQMFHKKGRIQSYEEEETIFVASFMVKGKEFQLDRERVSNVFLRLFKAWYKIAGNERPSQTQFRHCMSAYECYRFI